MIRSKDQRGEAVAFAATEGGSGLRPSDRSGGQQQDRSRVRSSHCDKIGHDVSNSFQLTRK